MCWKYEKEYDCCFDYIGGELGDMMENSILPFLANNYNIKVIDKWNFTELLFKLLNECHEKQYIKPNDAKFLCLHPIHPPKNEEKTL